MAQSLPCHMLQHRSLHGPLLATRILYGLLLFDHTLRDLLVLILLSTSLYQSALRCSGLSRLFSFLDIVGYNSLADVCPDLSLP
jgi:hypothetical protein